LKCPHDLTTRTSKGKATGNVLWSVEVTDNSVSMEPNAKVTLSSSHVPSQELPIGSHDVNVKATDNAGNFRTCTFGIEVRGKTIRTVLEEDSDLEPTMFL